MLGLTSAPGAQSAATPGQAADPRLERFKPELLADVERRRLFTQHMVDSTFSFGELGFQEIETAKYCVDILRKNGFTVEEGTRR